MVGFVRHFESQNLPKNYFSWIAFLAATLENGGGAIFCLLAL